MSSCGSVDGVVPADRKLLCISGAVDWLFGVVSFDIWRYHTVLDGVRLNLLELLRRIRKSSDRISKNAHHVIYLRAMAHIAKFAEIFLRSQK